MTFSDRVHHTITKYSLIKNGDTVIAGVSGGADSTALLEILNGLRLSMGLRIIAGHVHHGPRKTTGRDQQFIEDFCAQRGILCETSHVRLPGGPAKSLEEDSRNLRLNALTALARKHNADSVALGHHTDDLAETVLMRLIRGTGLQGLQAILPERNINGMRFIRPFLHVNREEIEAFLSQKKITFLTDPSNADTAFFRNKIRHDLLPILKAHYNPAITQALAGLAETAALDYEHLASEIETLFLSTARQTGKRTISFKIHDLHGLHPAVFRSLMRRAITALKGDTRAVTLDHIREIELLLNAPSRARRHAAILLPHSVKIQRQEDFIILRAAAQA